MNTKTLQIDNLISVIKILRGKNGCPWDKKQTADSLIKYLKEEVTELIDAISADDTANAREEIGDVLYVLIMITEIYSDKGCFSLNDSIENITGKLIRRHPHVFAGKEVTDENELRKQWENIKRLEKKKIN